MEEDKDNKKEGKEKKVDEKNKTNKIGEKKDWLTLPSGNINVQHKYKLSGPILGQSEIDRLVAEHKKKKEKK